MNFASSTSSGPGSMPDRTSPVSTSIRTSAGSGAPSKNREMAVTCSRLSTPTLSRVFAARFRSRANFRSPKISLAMKMSSMPFSAMTSASPILATVMPLAPPSPAWPRSPESCGSSCGASGRRPPCLPNPAFPLCCGAEWFCPRGGKGYQGCCTGLSWLLFLRSSGIRRRDGVDFHQEAVMQVPRGHHRPRGPVAAEKSGIHLVHPAPE